MFPVRILKLLVPSLRSVSVSFVKCRLLKAQNFSFLVAQRNSCKTHFVLNTGGVTSMDDFLKDFFPAIYKRKQMHLNETDYCKYDNQILTLFTSSLYFAGLISTFGASYVTRIYGRRGSILVGSVSFFLGGVINAAAKNILMLILGRIFLGIGIGFGNQA